MGIIIIRVKRLLIRLLIIIFLWIIFGCKHLSNYRYTWFYKYNFDQSELHSKMTKQLNISQFYWNQLLNKEFYYNNSISNNNICSVIISSPRNKYPTLHYTISSLVKSMTFKNKLNEKIYIYNTANPSYLNKYAQQLSEAKISFLQVINSSQFESYSNLKKIRFKMLHQQWIWNESIDYLFALSICEKINSKYILILQDDLIFTKNFFNKLNSIINKKLNCISIRLFKSDFWDGWQFEDMPFLILLSTYISTFIIIINLIIDNKKCYRAKWWVIQTHEKTWNISPCPIFILLSFWLIWLIFILIIIISTSRQNLRFIFGEKPGLYPMQSSVSGALAQLYPKWIIKKLEKYIKKRLKEFLILNRPKPIDILLNEFFQEQSYNLKQCHLIPDLVDHIGVYSSSNIKNQGDFLSMKQSGTFDLNEAAIDFY